MPLTTAVASLVPDPLMYAGAMSDVGFWVSTVEPGERVATRVRPEATTSGFCRPCEVGPCADQAGTMSLLVLVSPRSSKAPTVSTSGSSAGLRTVPGPGPPLPAATTTTTPWRQSFSTAKSRGSIDGSCVDGTPHERFRTPIPAL